MSETLLMRHPMYPFGTEIFPTRAIMHPLAAEAVNLVDKALLERKTPDGRDVVGTRSQYWRPSNADMVISLVTDRTTYTCWIFEPPTSQEVAAASTQEAADLLVGEVIGNAEAANWADATSAFLSALQDMFRRDASAARRFHFE